MGETRYVAITEGKDGSVRIFHKWIHSPEELGYFINHAENWEDGKLLAVFPEDAVALVCGL